MEEDSKGTDLGNVIRIDDERVRDHLGPDRAGHGRGDAERAAGSRGRSAVQRAALRAHARHGATSGPASYERKLQTKAGEVTLKVPKLRAQTFETAIIERYRRRESSVEEALDRDVSGRGLGASGRGHHRGAVGHAGEPRHGVRPQQEDLRARSRPGATSRSRASIPTSISTASCSSAAGRARCATCRCWWRSAVNADGYREILGICEGAKEDKAGWSAFLKHLKERGLRGVRLIISDACLGLVESAAEFFPEARWQRCMVHFYRNVFSHVPATKVREVAVMLKAIHASEDVAAAAQSKAVRGDRPAPRA